MIDRDGGVEAQGWPMPAGDRWVCNPRGGEDPNLDDSGRLGPRPVQCRALGDDPFEANCLLRFSGPPCWSLSDCFDRDLDIHSGGHETRVKKGLMHH